MVFYIIPTCFHQFRTLPDRTQDHIHNPFRGWLAALAFTGRPPSMVNRAERQTEMNTKMNIVLYIHIQKLLS